MNRQGDECINILLIDDDEDEYVIARELLSKIGKDYKVSWINNYKDGLEEILKHNYQLCLLDYHLDLHDGVEFIKEATLHSCSIPIILLTGQGDHEIDLAAMKAGASDYLDKRKLDVSTLERVVRYTLERKRSEEKIRFLAYYDQLTHLPNRTLFFDRLNTAISMAARYGRLCAVMFLDIDNFKRINDSLGHSTGDLLISKVGKRLRKCIRKEDTIVHERFENLLDTVARLGGDEFTILLSEIKEPGDASRVVERIRSVLYSPFFLEGKEVSITVSIGIALYPSDSKDIGTLIKYADIAMYNAKIKGKNTFRYYSDSMNTAALHRLNVENDLRKAVEKKELMVYYQPITNIKSGKIEGTEALVRWQHPQKGLVLPAEFIPVAEESGLINEIGNCVLEHVGAHYTKWRKMGLPEIFISVNISPLQLNRKDFPDAIAAWVRDFRIAPQHMLFEITENCIIHNTGDVYRIINAIRTSGIKVAMDDFGSGYSSFTILKEMTFDVLKIDYSFIKNVPTLPADSTIAASFISIGHSMNLTVLAEGIEREEQLRFLDANQCDLGQGYLFSRPLPEEEMVQLLKKQSGPGQ